MKAISAAATACLLIRPIGAQQAAGPSPDSKYAVTVNSIFYANTFNHAAIRGPHSDALYVLKITFYNRSDDTVFVLPKEAAFTKSSWPDGFDNRGVPTKTEVLSLDPCFILKEFRESLRPFQAPRAPYEPLCPPSPFAKVGPHEPRQLTLFCDSAWARHTLANSLAPDHGVDVPMPDEISVAIFSEKDREAIRAVYDPSETNNVSKAFDQAQEQIRTAETYQPLAIVKGEVASEPIHEGQREADETSHGMGFDWKRLQ